MKAETIAEILKWIVQIGIVMCALDLSQWLFQKVRTKKARRFTRLEKIVSVFIAVCAFVLFALNESIERSNKAADAQRGIILKNESQADLDKMRNPLVKVPQRLESDSALSEMIMIRFGGLTDVRSRKVYEDGLPLAQVVSMSGVPPFIVKIKKGEMLISTKVFDINGKLVAEMIENEWTVYSNLPRLRRNYDKYAIEVIDDYDITLLQVQYIDRQTIKICGVFFGNGGVLIADEVSIMSFLTPPVEELRKLSSGIKRIFKYSGDNYIGHRI